MLFINAESTKVDHINKYSLGFSLTQRRYRKVQKFTMRNRQPNIWEKDKEFNLRDETEWESLQPWFLTAKCRSLLFLRNERGFESLRSRVVHPFGTRRSGAPGRGRARRLRRDSTPLLAMKVPVNAVSKSAPSFPLQKAKLRRNLSSPPETLPTPRHFVCLIPLERWKF